MLCTFAHLEKEKLDELQSLEKKLGKTLLAYTCNLDVAPVGDDELAQIKQVENRLNISLVAVK